MPENVIISDQKILDKRLQAIRQDGPDSLHILSDFDRTLIKAYVDGKKIWSILAVIRDNDYLPPEYTRQAKAFAEKYYPIEKDASLPISERKQHMLDWWTKHFDLLISSGLKKNDIARAISSSHIQLRDGAEKFLELLHRHFIPLVIMSASGTGEDAISMFLSSKNLLTDNVHLISNKFVWDAHGQAIGVRKPIVHSLNKDETAIQDFPAYEKVKNRRNVILLGDFIDDIGMVTGFDYDQLLTVGFLNEDIEKNLPTFKKYFDVIITNDGPMDAVNDIIKSVIQ